MLLVRVTAFVDVLVGAVPVVSVCAVAVLVVAGREAAVLVGLCGSSCLFWLVLVCFVPVLRSAVVW